MTRKEVEKATEWLGKLETAREDLREFMYASGNISVALRGSAPDRNARLIHFYAKDLRPIVEARIAMYTAELEALGVTEF